MNGSDIFAADATGEPMHSGVTRLANGGVFVGWSHLVAGDKPLEVALRHDLGALPYGVQYWFWTKGSAAHHFLWSGRTPRPNEAGPVQIVTTADWLYFYFEPGKPFFSRFNEPDGSFTPLYEGRIGALVTPA